MSEITREGRVRRAWYKYAWGSVRSENPKEVRDHIWTAPKYVDKNTLGLMSNSYYVLFIVNFLCVTVYKNNVLQEQSTLFIRNTQNNFEFAAFYFKFVAFVSNLPLPVSNLPFLNINTNKVKAGDLHTLLICSVFEYAAYLCIYFHIKYFKLNNFLFCKHSFFFNFFYSSISASIHLIVLICMWIMVQLHEYDLEQSSCHLYKESINPNTM